MNQAMRDAIGSVAVSGTLNTATLSSISAQATPTPAQQILPMIEQRIRASIRAEVEQTRKHLESAIGAELVKLGFDAEFNKSWQFASEVATEYGEMLVRKRIKAIVDDLVNEKPAEPIAGSRILGKLVPRGEDTNSIITVTMPPNLTQPQRDAITANLKAQLPADTQLVSLVGGAQLGRL